MSENYQFSDPGDSGAADAVANGLLTGADYDYSPQDVLDAMQLANLSDNLSQTFTFNAAKDSQAANVPQAQEEPSLLDQGMTKLNAAGEWVNKNDKLATLLAAGIGGANTSANTKDAASKLAQGRLDELTMANAFKQQQSATNSANVLGMRQGLIGAQTQLQRTNGSNVFDNGKYIKG